MSRSCVSLANLTDFMADTRADLNLPRLWESVFNCNAECIYNLNGAPPFTKCPLACSAVMDLHVLDFNKKEMENTIVLIIIIIAVSLIWFSLLKKHDLCVCGRGGGGVHGYFHFSFAFI